MLENPVKTAISCFWTDAIARGPEMTATRDGVRGKEEKAGCASQIPVWNFAGNTLINQHSDINKTHDILQDEQVRNHRGHRQLYEPRRRNTPTCCCPT